MTPRSRRPRGRPPLQDTGRGADGRSPSVEVSLAASDLIEVQAIAAARDLPVAAVVRAAVTSYLRARRLALAPPPSSPSTSPRRDRSVTRRGAI